MDKLLNITDGLANVSLAKLSIANSTLVSIGTPSNRPVHLTSIADLSCLRAVTEDTDGINGTSSLSVVLSADDVLVPLTDRELEIVERYRDQAVWFKSNGHDEEAKMHERLAKQASAQFVYDDIIDELIIPEPTFKVVDGSSVMADAGGAIANRKDVFIVENGKNIRLFGKDGYVSNRVRNAKQLAERINIVVDNRRKRAKGNAGYQSAVSKMVADDNVVVGDSLEILTITKGEEGDFNGTANIPVELTGLNAIASRIAGELGCEERKLLGVS